jgi:hypothetical protein
MNPNHNPTNPSPSPSPNYNRPSALTTAQQDDLRSLELGIVQKYQVLLQIAQDLHQIRDRRLFEHTHPTFDLYCRERWGLEQEYFAEIVQTQSVIQDLLKLNLHVRAIPTSYEQIREFYGLNEPDRIKLAVRVDRELGEGKLTAGLIQDCKLKLFPDKCAQSKLDSSERLKQVSISNN